MLEKDFEKFCDNIKVKNQEEINITLSEITKKLNKKYYDIDDNKSNLYIVGSIGRGTASKNISDIDIIFNLPEEVYKQYDAHETNGQSNLLQDIKSVLKERYPNTDIKGDGQVVVISFEKYLVELNPGFKQKDNTFKYPDSNENGKWRTTNPLPEIETCERTNLETKKNFNNLCRILRAWKNNIGFKFKGLLIDTLVYNFFNDKPEYKELTYDEYFNLLKDLFGYIKKQNKEQAYWYALGSNQQIINSDKGKFIKKANEAYGILENIVTDTKNKNEKLRELLGKEFPKDENDRNVHSYIDTEEYIEDKYRCNIIHELYIDAVVTQDGYRPFKLRNMLENLSFRLKTNKKIEFQITNIDDFDYLKPYKIIWKIKNQGIVAKSRNDIRGQLIYSNRDTQIENSVFKGLHYAEAYIVKDNTCVARGRISVPIDEYYTP